MSTSGNLLPGVRWPAHLSYGIPLSICWVLFKCLASGNIFFWRPFGSPNRRCGFYLTQKTFESATSGNVLPDVPWPSHSSYCISLSLSWVILECLASVDCIIWPNLSGIIFSKYILFNCCRNCGNTTHLQRRCRYSWVVLVPPLHNAGGLHMPTTTSSSGAKVHTD